MEEEPVALSRTPTVENPGSAVTGAPPVSELDPLNPTVCNRYHPGFMQNLGFRVTGPGADPVSNLCNKVLDPSINITRSDGTIVEDKEYKLQLAIQDSLINNDSTCFNKLKFKAIDIFYALRFSGTLPFYALHDGQILDYSSSEEEAMIQNLATWFEQDKIKEKKAVMDGVINAFNDHNVSPVVNANKNRIALYVDLYGIIQKYGDDIKDADNKYKKCPNCERVKQPKNNTCVMGGKKKRKTHKKRRKVTNKKRRKRHRKTKKR